VKQELPKPQPPHVFLCFYRAKEIAVKVKVKKEPTPPMKKEKLWWEEEIELPAMLVRHLDDPEDALGQCLLEARSFSKVQPMDDDTASWWSALNSDNFIYLVKRRGRPA
jgi:hypothetical protein